MLIHRRKRSTPRTTCRLGEPREQACGDRGSSKPAFTFTTCFKRTETLWSKPQSIVRESQVMSSMNDQIPKISIQKSAWWTERSWVHDLLLLFCYKGFNSTSRLVVLNYKGVVRTPYGYSSSISHREILTVLSAARLLPNIPERALICSPRPRHSREPLPILQGACGSTINDDLCGVSLTRERNPLQGRHPMTPSCIASQTLFPKSHGMKCSLKRTAVSKRWPSK